MMTRMSEVGAFAHILPTPLKLKHREVNRGVRIRTCELPLRFGGLCDQALNPIQHRLVAESIVEALHQ